VVSSFGTGVLYERANATAADVDPTAVPPKIQNTVPALELPRGRKGRWVKVDDPLAGFDVEKYHSCKAFDAKDVQNNSQIARIQSWQWEGLNPDVMDVKRNEVYDAAKKCLSGKIIAFVGDSMSRQMHHAGVCLLHSVGHDTWEEDAELVIQTFPNEAAFLKRQECWRFPSMENAQWCYVMNHWLVGDLRSPLQVRNVALNRDRELDWQRLGGLTEQWARRNPPPDVMMFSGGTWYLSYRPNNYDTWVPHLTKAYRGMLDRLEELFQAQVLNVNVTYIIFRTINQHHMRNGWHDQGGICTHDAPMQHPEDDLYAPEYTSQFSENGAADLASKILHEEIALKPPSYNYWVLDGQAVSKERSDSHPGGVDCYHYIFPSVPDVWNRIMIKHLCKWYGH